MRNTEKSQGEFQNIFLAKAKKIHENKFNYDLVEYKNNRTPVTIQCNTCHNIFKVIPWNLFIYKDCPNCSMLKQRKSITQFIKDARQIHGDKYDYSQSHYVNATTKIAIKCNSCHNTFLQLPPQHTSGEQGCPTCRQSHGEAKISLILKLLDIRFSREYKFPNCIGKQSKLRFDFYLPDLNMCIEYDGRQHTDIKSKYWSSTIPINDKIKDDYCKNNNIKLKRIPYTEIENIEKILRNILFN